MTELAIAGGVPVRAEPYPEWPHGDDEDVAAVEEVVRGGRWGGFPEPGPKAAAFEEAFAAYQGARYGVLMSNGTVTMEVALKALGIGWGDEVIIPALTFAATVYAPIAAGALPVIVDVTPETWTIDPALVEAAITPRRSLEATRSRWSRIALTRTGSVGTARALGASATSARSATSRRRS